MNKGQRNRIVLVMVVLLAGGVFLRHVVRRGFDPSPLPLGEAQAPDAGEGVTAPPVADFAEVSAEELEELLRLARRTLEAPADGPPSAKAERFSPTGKPALVLSLSREKATALVARAQAETLSAAATRAAGELRRRATPEEIREGRLKIDGVVGSGPEERFDASGGSTVEEQLDGIWLPGPDLLLLPEEILSRRLLTDGGDLQAGRLRRYLEEGGRAVSELDGNPTKSGLPYRRLRFQSAAEGPATGSDRPSRKLYRGNLEAPSVTPSTLLEASRAGGEYLLRHQLSDGNFGYLYETQKDSYDDSYNLLRHAGSCYALTELYQATGDERFLAAARRGLQALLEKSRPPKEEHQEADFEAIVSPGEEAKLGGAALTILALMRYQEASGDASWLDRARSLARFMEFQQEPSGKFASKYFYGKPDAVPFESIYYPGEAILSSLRLYRVDPDPRWLAIARKGADYLIDGRDAGKGVQELPHDHWLLMGLNELYQLTGDPRYGEHGTLIALAILQAQRTEGPRLDWIGTFYTPPRSTPTATRAEALVAMHSLAGKVGTESSPYLKALKLMAEFQLRCQLTPENSLYLPRPDLSDGGFRRSLTDWEVRIDYVQHNVSALLGLRAILMAADEVP